MNKSIVLSFVILALILLAPALASAVRFDVQEAMDEEWARYEQYKADYIKQNHLEAFADQVDENYLRASFGFYGPSYYYIPPHVLAAKYNPPLQGEVYYTDSRGLSSSLEQPSAVKYYSEKNGTRYSGFVPSTLNGVYFDHPQANVVLGTATAGYAGRYSRYNNYRYGYGNSAENYRYYSRVADPLGSGYYVVAYS